MDKQRPSLQAAVLFSEGKTASPVIVTPRNLEERAPGGVGCPRLDTLGYCGFLARRGLAHPEPAEKVAVASPVARSAQRPQRKYFSSWFLQLPHKLSLAGSALPALPRQSRETLGLAVEPTALETHLSKKVAEVGAARKCYRQELNRWNKSHGRAGVSRTGPPWERGRLGSTLGGPQQKPDPGEEPEEPW